MVISIRDNWQFRLDTAKKIMPFEITGIVTGMTGLTIEVNDFAAPIGAACLIHTKTAGDLEAEVIGFRGEVAVLMPLGEMAGIAGGDKVTCISARRTVPLGDNLLGRVIDASGRPLDGKGPLMCQVKASVEADPIRPLERQRIDRPLGTGIRAVDGILTCGTGQRMGIFSGPGVGKSVLMGMIARNTSADVNVIALIGERGREVREFLERDLGPEGLARSVVIVSTSDEPAPVRVRSGFAACTVAEYFRDQGKDVLMLMDSSTRIAMAQRQIGLAMAEPPATKGYTPSVFSMLPRLLERCGKGAVGSITGFFTVLVEGDDLSDPIADAMRSILDGHLWLSRDLANRGHYPAIDILESVSRVITDIVNKDHIASARFITRLVSIYRDIEDLVNIGAYSPGANFEFDMAVQMKDEINEFLQQDIDSRISFDQAVADMSQLIGKMQMAAQKTQNAAG